MLRGSGGVGRNPGSGYWKSVLPYLAIAIVKSKLVSEGNRRLAYGGLLLCTTFTVGISECVRYSSAR
jgi:hypothetical protein